MKYIALALPLLLAACTAAKQEPGQRYAWEQQLLDSPALMSTFTEPMGLGNDDCSGGRPYYLDFNELFPPKSGEAPALPWDHS